MLVSKIEFANLQSSKNTILLYIDPSGAIPNVACNRDQNGRHIHDCIFSCRRPTDAYPIFFGSSPQSKLATDTLSISISSVDSILSFFRLETLGTRQEDLSTTAGHIKALVYGTRVNNANNSLNLSFKSCPKTC